MDHLYYIGFDLVAILAGGIASFQAWRANHQTKATGNGFAAEVQGALRRIEDKIDRHIEDHAERDLKR
ncbi:MAG: hypothetical protein ACRDRL_15250 [Sciscionella sp.]